MVSAVRNRKRFDNLGLGRTGAEESLAEASEYAVIGANKNTMVSTQGMPADECKRIVISPMQ
jgi:hypothetical protein